MVAAFASGAYAKEPKAKVLNLAKSAMESVTGFSTYEGVMNDQTAIDVKLANGVCGWVADPCPMIDYYDYEVASACPDGPICVPYSTDVDPDLYTALGAAVLSVQNCVTATPAPCTAEQETSFSCANQQFPSEEGPVELCMPPGYQFDSPKDFGNVQAAVLACNSDPNDPTIPAPLTISAECQKAYIDLYEGLTGCGACGALRYYILAHTPHCLKYETKQTCVNAPPLAAARATGFGMSPIGAAPEEATAEDNEADYEGNEQEESMEQDADAPSGAVREGGASSGSLHLVSGASVVILTLGAMIAV